MKPLKFMVLKGSFGVCRLPKNSSIPNWPYNRVFFSITKTDEELSIVCPQENIPGDVKVEKRWTVLKVEGPLDFSLTGILANLATILAKGGVSIFAVSTYDTDYILVKEKNMAKASELLKKAGFKLTSKLDEVSNKYEIKKG